MILLSSCTKLPMPWSYLPSTGGRREEDRAGGREEGGGIEEGAQHLSQRAGEHTRLWATHTPASSCKAAISGQHTGQGPD